ncbi:platelet-derived growth factor receptor alpha-like [Augochlora pura]
MTSDYEPLDIKYEIMCYCWNAKPSLRPSFVELAESVGNLLEDNVKAHYIELNAPYLDMNRALLEGGKNDYLTMISAPDYVMLSSPTRKSAKFLASGITEDSGYLSMSSNDATITSPMLNKEKEDPYSKPISVDANSRVEMGFAPTIISTRENYVNMRQQKSDIKKDLSEGKAIPIV